MAYQALYRKFRPPTFDDVRGQDHIVTTLRNQVKGKRVAHAYLFCGTRGTGKTSVAKILSRAINCTNEKDGNPCGECEVCKATLKGANLNVIEIDAASNNGVDSIREIVDEVSYSPTMGSYKVYIIDEAHMLTDSAFNALLKTLEEPPEYVVFILATTEVQSIPITILSRCQRYDFHRLSTATIEERLKEVCDKEGIQIEDKALRYIARSADGAMRDGLSLLDRCLAFLGDEKLRYEKVLDVLGTVDTDIFLRLFRALDDHDATAALQLISEVVAKGSELTQFVNDYVWFLRNLMLLHTSDAAEEAIDVYAESYEQMKAICSKTSLDTILTQIRVFSETSQQIRHSAQKRILLETAIIRICKPQMEGAAGVDLVSAERLAAVEREMERAMRLLRGIENGTVAVQEKAPASDASVKPKQLEQALPEDIKAIVEEWHTVRGNFAQPVRGYLEKAEPYLGEDGRLVILAASELNAIQLQKPATAEDLHALFTSIAGKEVSHTVTFTDDKKRFDEQNINLISSMMNGYPVEQDNY